MRDALESIWFGICCVTVTVMAFAAVVVGARLAWLFVVLVWERL